MITHVRAVLCIVVLALGIQSRADNNLRQVSWEKIQGRYSLMTGHVGCANLISAELVEKEGKKAIVVANPFNSRVVRFSLQAAKFTGKSAKGCREFERTVAVQPGALVMTQQSKTAETCGNLEYSHMEKEAGVVYKPGSLEIEYLMEPEAKQVMCQYRLNI
ncbi:MAG: hypothetical protein AB7O96_16680 [Pseudobdellovibrionaceae bacterium]